MESEICEPILWFIPPKAYGGPGQAGAETRSW